MPSSNQDLNPDPNSNPSRAPGSAPDPGAAPAPAEDPNAAAANPAPPSASVAPTPAPPPDWRAWARRLLVCNPFFLCSAALLLFAVNRLSTDDRLFQSDLHNLFFNFFSLEAYELVVVASAVLLARRRVWYDSALLVVLEHGLLLVPLLLISQATLEGMGYAWLFLASAVALAVGRFTAVRRGYPRFNLPGRAVALGATLFAANAILPLVFRPLMEKDVADWTGPNELLWLVLLPLAALGANVLPQPAPPGTGAASPLLPSERRWLPLFIYGLWIAGSAVHVWCIAHICGLPLELRHLAPLASVALWSLQRRLTDCVAAPSPQLRAGLLVLTAAAPPLAFGHPGELLLLGSVHLAAYLLLGWGRQTEGAVRSVARQLALSTAALLIAGWSTDWLPAGLPRPIQREHLIAAALAAYAILHCALSGRPALGFAGAAITGIGCGFITRPDSLHPMFQAAAAFLFVHSLRWNHSGPEAIRDGADPNEAPAGTDALRWSAAVIWIAESFLAGPRNGLLDPVTLASAGIVCFCWLAYRCLPHAGLLWSVPLAAVAAALATPVRWSLQRGSPGLWALAGSGALFGLGLWFAWNRTSHRPSAPNCRDGKP